MARPLPALLASAVALLGVTWLSLRTEADLDTPRDLHGAAFEGAEACWRCHPSHFESWRQTFHGRMTQGADETSVQGDFDDAELTYFGVGGRAHRDREGDFVVTSADGFGPPGGERVVRTVGSRRYQQYLVERDGVLVRLPWAWHLEDDRWFHMNGAFLTPDPEATPPSRADFERHVTRWDDNCIFCHNVAPNPGKHGGGFDSEVAELGVACEACHGPAEAHAAANQDPFRRYHLHLSGRADPTVVNPARLTPARSADVCGRCHGQRLTDDIEAFLRDGDPFVPGDDLARFSEPLWRDTTLRGQPHVFAPRFWEDGTARLTAYEYQGLLQSPCAQRGELTCTTCHGMHEGDPEGQLRPAREGDAMCIDCHAELATSSAAERHARHAPADGVACVDCHMPRVVYGVMDAHRSHRIELPDPAAQAAAGRPDACTLCHLERSRDWAARQRDQLWPGDAREPFPGGTPDAEIPELERALFAGDPVERALAAAAVGRSSLASGAVADRYAQALLDVMENDPYPAVRRLAWRSLGRLIEEAPVALHRYRADTPLTERRPWVTALRETGPGASPALSARHARLRAQAPQDAIHIGE